jgi:hypothetical protein
MKLGEISSRRKKKKEKSDVTKEKGRKRQKNIEKFKN